MDTRRARLTRRFRAAGYAALGTGGVILTVVSLATGDVLRAWVLWPILGALLALGSLASLFGAATNRWTGEYVGLPMVASALFAFGVLRGMDGHWSLVGVPAIFLCGVGVLIVARWLDVDTLRRASEREMHRKKERRRGRGTV